MYKTDDEEHVDTWEKTVPTCNSLTSSNWFNSINKQTSFNGPFSNLNMSENTNIVSSKAIILPTRFSVDDSKLNELSIKEDSNFGDNKQVFLKNGKFNKSPNYLFKKSLLLNQNSEYEKKVQKTKKTPEPTTYESILSTNEENRHHKLNTSQLKKRLRSLVKTVPQKKSNTYLCWSLIFFLLLPVTMMFLALVFNNVNTSNGFCIPKFNLQTSIEEVKKLVYGQGFAVNELATFFNAIDNETRFEVAAFVGGIGVGKSYTAEIIKNNVKATVTVVDVFPPVFNKEDQVYGSLSICHCNLIRLENLKTDDIDDVASFISNLKRRAEKYCVLVLTLFNTQEMDHNLKRTIDIAKSVEMIGQKFREKNLQPRIFGFSPLSNEALLKCIKDAANYNNLKLSAGDTEYVMRDLLAAESGCKGAYAKVQLVGKS